MSTEAITPTTLDTLQGTWTIDTSHSSVGFVARHAMVTKVRGAFNDYSGTAVVGESLADSRVEVEIDANSVDTRSADRDAHLRSNDFFGTEDHAKITFVSTSVAKTGDDSFDLTGDLTIKGTTKSVTIPFTFDGAATDPFGNARAGFSGSTVVNRKDFGLTWNAALETGGVLVSEKVTLEFDISAIKTA
ncbi:polyisoprenoid-binding protein [Nostocoides sp. F2B08]|uniref:YceI family protein n=1 Tax=Nostocoides sp. F2B08 TaxID=2653936 RepID=UPI001263618A|nr:YceI family protein [Tetrasphaera sp. F2B08]KAB7743940.1 polyisoprenoid-binding protein [Tetrasphaera sp. F2B08]